MCSFYHNLNHHAYYTSCFILAINLIMHRARFVILYIQDYGLARLLAIASYVPTYLPTNLCSKKILTSMHMHLHVYCS